MGKSKSKFKIADEEIRLGEHKRIDVPLARLPSGTQIDLPLYVYRSKKPGPCLFLSGGLHGDEINGIEIVRRLIEESAFDLITSGTVVAMPVINIYGFLNFSREVPDGKDVNRSFPGNATGSLAARVANFITKKLLPAIDIGVDFHTGGASRFNFPQIRYSSKDKNAKKLAYAFAPPVILQSPLLDKTLRKQAYKMGKTLLVYEGGESMRMNEEVIREGMEGTKRLLHHLEMLDDARKSATEPIYCPSSSWVRAKRSGIYTGHLEAGMNVNRGDILGQVTDPFGDFKVYVKSNVDGIIIGHNNMPVVNQGDALLHIGKI